MNSRFCADGLCFPKFRRHTGDKTGTRRKSPRPPKCKRPQISPQWHYAGSGDFCLRVAGIVAHIGYSFRVGEIAEIADRAWASQQIALNFIASFIL
jgi:hypothetical protein